MLNAKLSLLVSLILTISIALNNIPFTTSVWAEPPQSIEFDGQRAFEHLEQQMAYGPRTIGSLAHTQTVAYIKDILLSFNWTVNFQEFTYKDHDLKNIQGVKAGNSSIVIISAHYDCRWHADRDSINRTAPVPGANDGASGVGVLLELARVLNTGFTVWLVFFDAEDQGNIDGWSWIVGSNHFASQISATDILRIKALINVDMIGDSDLNIYKEGSSTAELTSTVWDVAKSLNYSEFIDVYSYTIIDDHKPFLDLGLPALDIIDFDYPYWHTQNDTTDKCSPESLEKVGIVLETFIEQRTIDFSVTQPISFAGIEIIILAIIVGIATKKVKYISLKRYEENF
ncbi:MAG: M28 family peptidase [Promethearchaeota archaeon]